MLGVTRPKKDLSEGLFCYDRPVTEHLCYSSNQVDIVFDPIESHAATHLEDTPELKRAVVEALSKTAVLGESMIFEHNLGRVIGKTDLVETTDEDEIIYAKRKNRQTPGDCSTVTIFLERQPDQTYVLGSAWVGYLGPSFPGDENETRESRPYWNQHALVWGRQEIQSGTETTGCPW